MLSGDLTDLITVVEKSYTQQGAANTQMIESEVAQWRGKVVELSAQGRKEWGAIHSEVTHEIRLRGSAPSVEFGKVEFKAGNLRLKPLAPPRRRGHGYRERTSIPCRDMAQDRKTPGSGSGS